MTRINLSLVALLFVFSQAYSQNVYLKYDENCMDRLEYSSADLLGTYVSYSFRLGEKKFLIFDIGKEDAKLQRELPGKLVYCNDIVFDKNLVNQINEGKVKIFVVRESPAQYQVTAVDKASYFEQVGDNFEFLMEDAGGVLNTRNPVSQVNLASPGYQKEIYLEGILNMQCLTGYIIQKKEDRNSNSFKEYVLLPDLGIAEKSSVSGFANFQKTTKTSALKLMKVGPATLNETITAICDRLQAAHYDGKPATATGLNDGLVAKTGMADLPTAYGENPCAPSQVDGIHVVQKGETLYGISRRYGISVDQIKQWNKLENTNLISLCQTLYVKEPIAGTQPTSTATASTQFTEKSGAAGYWMKAPEVHTVKPGETIAGLAYMYGYTEDRFRKMNGLSVGERVYIGQKLRTNDCVCPTLQSTTKDTPLPYEAETEKLTPKGDPDVYFRPVKIHLVKDNETLFSIAKLYDTTVERILELNGMKKGENISRNQRIYVQ